MISSVRAKLRTLCCSALCLVCLSCATRPPFTPTPDHAALETQVAAKLNKTITALAPTRTLTATSTPIPPTETPLPTPTATNTPTPTVAPPQGPIVACVRPAQNLGPNVVLRDLEQENDEILTHLTDVGAINDVTWSPDGAWVLFVSGHEYLASRSFGHNVFRVRPDGTELSMITGDYLDPETAPGPYTTVTGQIQDAPGPCQVYAQGATGPVTSDDKGVFELQGVPTISRWVRAVYQEGDHVQEAIADLTASRETFEPITLTLRSSGQGWRQADLHPDGRLLVGTTYTWTHQAGQEMMTRYAGTAYDLDEQRVAFELENMDDAALDGVVWSPNGKEIIGAMTGETAVYLWRWDDEGNSLGALVEIPRPDDDLISIAHPAWSPDGSLVAFELRHQFWWTDPVTFKTDILIASADGQAITALTTSDWGQDAREPSWSSDGRLVYYQYSVGAPDQSFVERDSADLWSIRVADAVTTQWTNDGQTYVPSCRAPRE